MTAAFADPGIHRMTVEQYEQFVADNDLDRVELIDGVMYDVSPEQNLHSRAVAKIFRRLTERYPEVQVNASGSVRLDDGSLWDPDVFVVDAGVDEILPGYPAAHDVLVTVEVSVSTWHRDASLKRDVYARNGIGEYWVVDPKLGGVVIRHTAPSGGTYGDIVSVPLPDGLAALDRTWAAVERR